MKRKILFLFACMFSLVVNAQNEISSQFIKEITSFIKATQTERDFYKEYRNIYFINFFNKDTMGTENKLCFTISYIRNDYQLEYISVTHSLALNKNEEILLNISSEEQLCILSTLRIEPIDENQLLHLSKRLWQKEIGSFLGTVEAEICCISKNKVQKRFYENSDEIPFDLSIYNINIWDSVKVDMIKDLGKEE